MYRQLLQWVAPRYIQIKSSFRQKGLEMGFHILVDLKLNSFIWSECFKMKYFLGQSKERIYVWIYKVRQSEFNHTTTSRLIVSYYLLHTLHTCNIHTFNWTKILQITILMCMKREKKSFIFCSLIICVCTWGQIYKI